jgi:hypothetical protein
MRAQVILIRKIMDEILHYPHSRAATSTNAVNYEIKVAIDAIAANKPLNIDKVPHMEMEQISRLQAAQVTKEDLAEARRWNKDNIKLLQDTLTDLMTENNITEFTAQWEIEYVLIGREPRYPGNYSTLLKAAAMHDVDLAYAFIQMRMEPLKAMTRLFASIPPKLAMEKIRKSSNDEIGAIWWGILSTRNEIKSMALQYMLAGMTAEAFARMVLDFMTNNITGLLNPAEQQLLNSKDPIYVNYLFSPEFLKHLNTSQKELEIEEALKTDDLTHMVNRINNTIEQEEGLEAYAEFINCYEKKNCGKLFSQNNIAVLLEKSAPLNFSSPANATIEAQLPVFLLHNPEFLNTIAAAQRTLQPSLVMLTVSFLSEKNPLLAEVAIISALSIYLFRNQLYKLNPFRYFKSADQQTRLSQDVISATSEELAKLKA